MDHSFERLIRSSRAQSPFQREFSSSYRDLKSSARDSYPNKFDTYATKSLSTKLDAYSSKFDSYSSKLDSYTSLNRDSLPTPISYRSKSYNGDLNRIPQSTFTRNFDDNRLSARPELYISDRSRSRSVSHLDTDRDSFSSIPSSYVNTYSRHHSHHNHYTSIPPRTPVQMHNRSRFHARSAYKAYRSRSVNRLDEHDYSTSQSVRSNTSDTFRSPSALSSYSSRSLLSSARYSKSLSDIRAIQSRINNELTLHLQRASSSIRNIDDYTELASHILNPDIYVRWLKNKWDMEENYRRQQSLSVRSQTEDLNERMAKNARLRGSSYPTRSKYSHESRNRPQIPTFSKTIRGKSDSN